RGRRVRHQAHVRLIDRLPAGDRRTVEHLAFRKRVFLDHADVEGDVLPLAARIGEAEIDVFHVVILDHLHDVFSCGHRTQIPLVLNVPCETGARGLLDGIDPGFTGPDPDGLFDIGDEYLAVANSTSLSGAPDRI